MAAKSARKSRRKKATRRPPKPHADQDMRKGAFESDTPGAKSQTSLRGQLPHNIQDELLKDSDSDRSG